MSFRIHTRYDLQRILGTKGFVDHFLCIFASVVQVFRHSTVLYGLVPDSCDSRGTVNILKERVSVVDSGIQNPYHDSASHEVQSRIGLDHADSGVVHRLQIHQFITVGNRIVPVILQ